MLCGAGKNRRQAVGGIVTHDIKLHEEHSSESLGGFLIVKIAFLLNPVITITFFCAARIKRG
jgi:hypothetical protein